MVSKKTWEEFRETGLLFYINQILHVFGWAIVVNVDDNGNIINAYPARVKFRGFSTDVVDKGYTQVTQYLKANVDELLSECEYITEAESEDKE
jgi:hypothetical protein